MLVFPRVFVAFPEDFIRVTGAAGLVAGGYCECNCEQEKEKWFHMRL